MTADQVLRHNQVIASDLPELWPTIEALVADSVRRGFLAPAAVRNSAKKTKESGNE